VTVPCGELTSPDCIALRTYSTLHLCRAWHKSSTSRHSHRKDHKYTRNLRHAHKHTHVQIYTNTIHVHPPTYLVHTFVRFKHKQTECQLSHWWRAVSQYPDYCLSRGQERIRIWIDICEGAFNESFKKIQNESTASHAQTNKEK